MALNKCVNLFFDRRYSSILFFKAGVNFSVKNSSSSCVHIEITEVMFEIVKKEFLLWFSWSVNVQWIKAGCFCWLNLCVRWWRTHNRSSGNVLELLQIPKCMVNGASSRFLCCFRKHLLLQVTLLQRKSHSALFFFPSPPPYSSFSFLLLIHNLQLGQRMEPAICSLLPSPD